MSELAAQDLLRPCRKILVSAFDARDGQPARPKVLGNGLHSSRGADALHWLERFALVGSRCGAGEPYSRTRPTQQLQPRSSSVAAGGGLLLYISN